MPILFGQTSISIPIYDMLGWLVGLGPKAAWLENTYEYHVQLQMRMRVRDRLTIVPALWVAGTEIGRGDAIRLARPDDVTIDMITAPSHTLRIGASCAVDFGLGRTRKADE